MVQALVTERRASLGIRELRVELLKDPLHDASPESKVVTLLRGYLRTPKECFEDILAFYGIPRSNALYRELARYESLEGCVVPSFRQFVETLKAWFPLRTS